MEEDSTPLNSDDDVIDHYMDSFGTSQLIQALIVSLAWMFDVQ